MKRPIISVTMGDPAGIGAEIAVKALDRRQLYEMARPVVIGSKVVIEDALRFVPVTLKLNVIDDMSQVKGEYGAIDLFDLDNIAMSDFKYGEIGAATGKASIEYVLKGIELAQEGKVDAVVTGPIHKEAINVAGYEYSGHTEIFASATGTEDYAMMLVDDKLRVIHVSTHVSLRKACDLVKKDRVISVVRLAKAALERMGMADPRIAVAGLNPHAGESGLFGSEEIEEIIPAINQAKKEGIRVDGPIPPDTIFSKVRGGQYDIAVAMYHDQGHIPMKVTGFKYNEETMMWTSISGVNITVGLPIIRTSVDHGVAFDKAGAGEANEQSMIEAIKMAAVLAR